MKISLSPVTKLLLASITSIGVAFVFLPQPTLANTSADKLENNYTGQPSSSIGSAENDSTPIGNLMELINRVGNNGRVIDPAAQRQQIDEEANNFLQRQQQMFNSQPTVVPAQPNTTTQPSGN